MLNVWISSYTVFEWKFKRCSCFQLPAQRKYLGLLLFEILCILKRKGQSPALSVSPPLKYHVCVGWSRLRQTRPPLLSLNLTFLKPKLFTPGVQRSSTRAYGWWPFLIFSSLTSSVRLRQCCRNGPGLFFHWTAWDSLLCLKLREISCSFIKSNSGGVSSSQHLAGGAKTVSQSGVCVRGLFKRTLCPLSGWGNMAWWKNTVTGTSLVLMIGLNHRHSDVFLFQT